VRWNNEDGVMITWQVDYTTPIAPGLGIRGNRRVEKLVERLAFLPRDFGTGEEASRRAHAIVTELDSMGIRFEPEAQPA
jgi:hypothetical protein